MAVIAALFVEGVLTELTTLFVGPNGGYGAPLLVGRSCGFGGVISLGCKPVTFSLAPFEINVVITALVFGLPMWRGGHPVLMTLGAVLFLVIAIAMNMAELPFAGIPLPVSYYPSPRDTDQLKLWIDCIAGAALFALPGIVRSARAPQVPVA